MEKYFTELADANELPDGKSDSALNGILRCHRLPLLTRHRRFTEHGFNQLVGFKFVDIIFDGINRQIIMFFPIDSISFKVVSELSHKPSDLEIPR